MEAVNSEQLDAVQQLLRNNACVNDMNMETGWAPLHLASSNGNLDILRALVDAGANMHLLLSSGTPLHVAAGSGHVDIVRELLARGVHVDTVDDCGCSALHYASQHGHIHVVDCLVCSGANTDLRQNEGATSLYLATYFGQNEVAELLIGYGVDVTIADRAGYTPADVAKQTLNWYLTGALEDAKSAITFV